MPEPIREIDPGVVRGNLERVRERSAGLTTAVLDEGELLAQHSRLMSPLVWDLAHVGNYEELWLLRETHGDAAMRPDIDDLGELGHQTRLGQITNPRLAGSRLVADPHLRTRGFWRELAAQDGQRIELPAYFVSEGVAA